VESAATGKTLARFGLFEADLQQRVLTRNGLRVRLQDQPFQVLAILLERPGEIVTRDRLREKLWSADNYVEFDDGLNTAIKKLRLALGDTADNPRFVETVHRRGYRFVAPVSFFSETKPEEVGPSSPKPSPLRSEPTTLATEPGRAAGHLRYVPAIIAGILIVGTFATYLLMRPHPFRVTSADSIVLADFANTTGETVFDDALREATEVGLQQSPYLNILSDRKMAALLKQMGRSAGDHTTGQMAIELCQRAGSKIAVQGSVSSIGTTYLVGLAAIRCDNGSPIALEQVQAQRREDVVDALGSATTRLRARLGESLPSIQKYDVPLEQATTPSLDALKAYSQALSTQVGSGDIPAIPFFKRAIDIDSNFALAYGSLAAVYRNLGETELSRQNAIRAFASKDRVTDFERLSIEAWYQIYATENLEQAAEIFEVERKTYPVSSRNLNDLGVIYGSLGRFDKEIDIDRESLRNGSSAAATYGNLAVSLMALGRFDEADNVLLEASKTTPPSDYLLQVSYWRAFLRGDDAEMQRLLLQSSSVSAAQSLLLSEQANTEAYYGHLRKSRELALNAAALLQKQGQADEAGLCLAQAAVREAEIGDSPQTRDLLAKALNLTHDQHVLRLSAFALVRIGDLARGKILAEKFARQYPSSTFVQKYWLPLIYAAIELRKQNGTKAVELLNTVASFDMAAPDEFSTSTLYPAFVRGQAYLAVDDDMKAAEQFKRLTDHPGMVLNFPLGALARLELARAYSRTNDIAKASEQYQVFLQLWKDADPDNSVLKQAKSEYTKLTRGMRTE
jgi:DNA-binding winged helix-turn-helix (wHTH) protein/Tfp pilus assembly protein PilF